MLTIALILLLHWFIHEQQEQSVQNAMLKMLRLEHFVCLFASSMLHYEWYTALCCHQQTCLLWNQMIWAASGCVRACHWRLVAMAWQRVSVQTFCSPLWHRMHECLINTFCCACQFTHQTLNTGTLHKQTYLLLSPFTSS